jgi:hypothetical protein
MLLRVVLKKLTDVSAVYIASIFRAIGDDAQHRRRQSSSYSPPRETETSPYLIAVYLMAHSADQNFNFVKYDD